MATLHRVTTHDPPPEVAKATEPVVNRTDAQKSLTIPADYALLPLALQRSRHTADTTGFEYKLLRPNIQGQTKIWSFSEDRRAAIYTRIPQNKHHMVQQIKR